MPESDPPPELTEKEIFDVAAALPAGEREAHLDAACGENLALRARLERLLRSPESGGFMGRPADRTASAEVAAELARLKPEESGEWIGHYKLLQQIGEGGFGVVWMAEQERPVRRRVALKIIKLGMDTKEVIARFEQERQALAMMDHPNIAKVLDAGATPFGRPYFAMELVRGIKITDYCDQASLSTGDRLRLFICVCNAVQHAHQKGIIHRDIKPSNILVTLHDGVPVPKVIDFGVAKATQSQRLTDLTLFTHFEQMIGTPLYMSPEQAELSGLDIDTRSDIYSLGVLLYELLTGRTPFDPDALMRAGLDEIRRVIREEEPKKPSTFVSTMAMDARTALAKHRQADSAKLVGQIRGDLDWIVMKALEKDRNRRYGTANGLAQDIERHLGSEPVQARPPSQLYRFRRFARRNKIAFAAGACVAVALIAGTIVSTWQAVRAHRSGGHARVQAERASTEASRANAALAELRATAPAFVAEARSLVAKGRFQEALEKLDIAIKLRPADVDQILVKADLLEAQLRFAEASAAYELALQLDPGRERAQANANLCKRLAIESSAGEEPRRTSLEELYALMKDEARSSAEMMPLAERLGTEQTLTLNYWLERLKDLPIPPGKPLAQRLELQETGPFALDLSGTPISDLSPLEGMPLGLLNLTGCEKVTDLRPIRNAPLRTLILNGTGVTDVSPLRGMQTLGALYLRDCKIRDVSPLGVLLIQTLDLGGTQVTDLAPVKLMWLSNLDISFTPVSNLEQLRGKRLQVLNLVGTNVTDLSPIADMPLGVLTINNTPVTDLRPLAGMQLRRLECMFVPATDFSPLSSLPLLELEMNGCEVRDLSFLKDMPLNRLHLDLCGEASGFDVLNGIKSLASVHLPGSVGRLPSAEIKAITALRQHPSLRKIGYDTAIPVAEFWDRFEEDLHDRQAFTASFDAAEAMARKGNFAETDRLLQAMQKQTKFKANDVRYARGIVALAQGDKELYLKLCNEAVTSLPTTNPAGRLALAVTSREVPVQAVLLCLLNAAGNLPESFNEAYQAINKNEADYFAYEGYCFLRAVAFNAYRHGDFDGVITRLERFKTDCYPALLPFTAAILAMAHHQKGDAAAAKAALIRARDLMKGFWPEGKVRWSTWPEWLYADLLIRQAEQLLEKPPRPLPGKVEDAMRQGQ